MELKDYKFLFIALFCVNNIFSQEITFEVLDKESKYPLAFVNVFENKVKFLGVTNEQGRIKVTPKSASATFSFQLLGHKTLVVNTYKESNTIFLESNFEKLSEVVIAAKKNEQYELTQLKPVEGTHIYAGKKSEVVNLDLVVANKATNNARQIYARVAGLNIYDNGDGGLQLNIGGRGLDPNRTANFNVRQNDYDISADVLGYPESYYTPPAEAIDKIQIVRGAASLQYGTQFGGLINFKLKKPTKNKPIELITRNTIASFGTLTKFTSIGGTTGKLSYYAYGNFKRGDGYRPNSEYESRNIFAYLSYALNTKTTVSVEGTHFYYLAKQAGGLSDVQFLENPFQSTFSRNWFAVNWNLFNLKLNHQFTDNVEASISFFALNADRKAVGFRGLRWLPGNTSTNIRSSLFGGDDQDAVTGIYEFNRDVIVGRFQNYGGEARVVTKYDIGTQNSILLLGTKFYKANNSAQQGPGSKGVDADFSIRTSEFPGYPNQSNFNFPNLNVAVFGENVFNISDTFSITPGFRYEFIQTKSNGTFTDITGTNPVLSQDNNSLNRQFVLLGIGVSYKPKSYFESYFNISQNYRSVTFSDIRTVSPTFVIDPNITDEKGYTLDIGLRGTYKKAVSYDVSAFSLFYDNRLGQRFSTTPPYRAQWVRGNIGQAVIIGLESLLQWNLKETFFKAHKNLQLRIFSNLALTHSEYTSAKESNIQGNEVEFVPNVNLKTGLSFGYKDFLSSVQYTYISEQFTDATNSRHNPKNDVDVSGAIPAYAVLDFSTSYKINKNFKLETGVNNVLNNSYFTRRATGYPGPGIIPAAPRNLYGTLEIKF